MCNKKNCVVYVLILQLFTVFIVSNALASSNPYKRRTRQQSKLEKIQNNVDDESTGSEDEDSSFDEQSDSGSKSFSKSQSDGEDTSQSNGEDASQSDGEDASQSDGEDASQSDGEDTSQSNGEDTSQLEEEATNQINNDENSEIENQSGFNDGINGEVVVDAPYIQTLSNEIIDIDNVASNIEDNIESNLNQSEPINNSFVSLEKTSISKQNSVLLNNISQLEQNLVIQINSSKNSEIENQNEVNNFDKEITVSPPVINIISNDAETINNEENNFENLNDNDIDLNQNELLKKSVVLLTKPDISEKNSVLLNDVPQLKQSKTELIIDDTENDKNQNEVNDINKEIAIDVPTVQVLGNEVADVNGAKIDSNEKNNMEDNNEQNNIEDNNEQNNIDSNDSDEQKEHKESNSSDKNNEKSKQNDKNIKIKSLLYVNMHNNIIHNMLSNANITKSNKNFNFNLKYDSNINNNIIYNNETVKNRLLNASVNGKFNIVDNDIIKLDSMLFAGYNNVNYNNHYYIGLLNNIYIIDDLDISLVLNFLTNKEILKDNNIINNSFSGAINIAYKIDLSNNFTVKPGFYISYINVGKINDYKYSITNIPNVSLLFKFDKLTANFAVKYFMNNSDLTHDKLQDLNMTNGMVCSTGIDYEIFDNFNVNFNVNFNKNSTHKFNLSFGLVYSF